MCGGEITVSIYSTLTDSWHCALTCVIWHLAWRQTLLFKNALVGKKEILVILQWIFLDSFPSFYPECCSCSIHPKLLHNSQALQMICLSLCDLHNIHTRWCDASQIRKSPHKNQRWWKPSALHSWQGGWRGRGAGCCLPLLLLFSLWGLRWVSRLCLFLLSLPVFNFWLSYSLCCFSSLNLFLFLSHPPFIPPSPVLALSQGLNLWLWSYRNIGMTTHALLCFVSVLACWLDHWLAGCTECVFTCMYCMYALNKKKKVFILSLFPVSLIFPFQMCVCLCASC